MWTLGTTLAAALNLVCGNVALALVLAGLALAETLERRLEKGAPLNPLA